MQSFDGHEGLPFLGLRGHVLKALSGDDNDSVPLATR
jgi:hypothetical protein